MSDLVNLSQKGQNIWNFVRWDKFGFFYDQKGSNLDSLSQFGYYKVKMVYVGQIMCNWFKLNKKSQIQNWIFEV